MYCDRDRMRVEAIKARYPAGTRRELVHMNDPYAPVPSGTRGDESQIHKAVVDTVNGLLPNREVLLHQVQRNLRQVVGEESGKKSPQALQIQLDGLEQRHMQTVSQAQTDAEMDALIPLLTTLNEQISTLRSQLEQLTVDAEQNRLL